MALLLSGRAAGQMPELRPGVWQAHDFSSLPLPVSSYDVYLLGELHGVQDTEEIFAKYMARLHASAGLRDVAIEEDAVYQAEARAYVEGRSSTVPAPLCLRACVLQTIRRFNQGQAPNDIIRVHLVDIDSPAPAIRAHLLAIQERIPEAKVVCLPRAGDIKTHGLATVDELRRLTADARILGELRTVGASVRALQAGLEVGTAGFKGSPYLDERDEAIASNIHDVLRQPGCRAVLALYGWDHVSKARRKVVDDQGEREFSPLALRLRDAGARVFSLVMFPLSGRTRWRGHEGEIFWTAKDGALAGGETLDRLLAAVPSGAMLYVDPSRQKIRLPSQDVSAFAVDAFLLLAGATAMEDQCSLAGRR